MKEGASRTPVTLAMMEQCKAEVTPPYTLSSPEDALPFSQFMCGTDRPDRAEALAPYGYNRELYHPLMNWWNNLLLQFQKVHVIYVRQKAMAQWNG